MSYLVDSDHVIAFLKGVPGALELFQLLAPSGVSISIVTYAEVSEGVISQPADSAQARGWSEFLAFVEVIPVDRVVADKFADLRRTLRTSGNLAPDLDLLIAATALAHDLTLATGNLRRFERVPGLRIYRG